MPQISRAVIRRLQHRISCYMPARDSTSLLVILVLVLLSEPASAHDFDIDECISGPSAFFALDPAELPTPQEDCSNKAMIHSQWHADGSPTVRFNGKTCEYDGQVGVTPDECLPDTLPYNYVELAVEKRANADKVVKFVDALRERGVRTVLMGELEDGI